MNEFLEQFLIECRELVEQGTHDLLALEDAPGDRDRLDSAFRAFHTLKGAAGIVDFTAMAIALHAAEDRLSAIRSGDEPVTPLLIGDCLTCLDQVVQWLDATEAAGEPPTGAEAEAAAIVKRFGGASAPDPPADPAPPRLDRIAHDLVLAQVALLANPATEPSPGRTASAARVAINVLKHAGRAQEAAGLEQALARPGAYADPAVVVAALKSLATGSLDSSAESPREAVEAAARSLRVDVERVDALVSLTGELTVAKNALAHAAAQARDGVEVKALAVLLKDQHTVLDRLVSELQRSVLNIRVLPLRHVFQRFPRLVREMVVSLGKPARLVTEGDATEADKAIVESMFEPLLHVMRNALDHGVESAEVRAAAGKPPSATIRLSARREGDRVLVEVADDGGGVDVARVRQVALERALLSAEALADLSDEAAVDLIFTPGFSTAGEVTSVSGRGVGMDAVRTAIERLGGRVAIETRPGQGTTVHLILPFTVMMTRVMTVEAGGQMFGIPMEAVVETMRLAPDRIAPIGSARAFVFRDRTLPLIDLGEALGDGRHRETGGDTNVVVAMAGGQLGGLAVERLGERIDVMLKPMEGLLAGTPGVAGATLMGDGRVLIVLDLQELLD